MLGDGFFLSVLLLSGLELSEFEFIVLPKSSELGVDGDECEPLVVGSCLDFVVFSGLAIRLGNLDFLRVVSLTKDRGVFRLLTGVFG